MSSKKLPPRESGKFIANHAKNITIENEGVQKLGNEIIEKVTNGELSISNFSQNTIHPKASDPWAVDWLFVVDTLNFCFWSLENEQGWCVEGYTGYFALCAAINRAKDNMDILNPKFYSTITQEQAEKVFKSDNKVTIPLMDERIKCLHEVGSILLENFEGSFANVVKQANKSARKLLQLIVDHFPCFRDEAVYKNQRVCIYKRAQILVGDIWACFRGQGLGEFFDIEEITMFADYRVPQSLLDFGVFTYSETLLKRLNSKELIPNGDEMEVEIRGCSIHACELIKEYVNAKMYQDDHQEKKQVNSILIDHFLWDYRRKYAQEILKKGLPFHKTLCIYY